MKKLMLAMCCFAVLGTSAQNARVKTYTTPLAGKVVLGEIDDKYAAEVFSLEAPSPDGNLDKIRLAEAKRQVAEKYPPRKLLDIDAYAKSTAAPSPVVLSSFKADSFPGIPPDNYMAISQDKKAVSVINNSITVINAQGGQITNKVSLYYFTLPAGLLNQGINQYNYKYDPKIMYDPEADRFITVILNGTDQYNWIVMGFSQTNDPAGGWNFYKFYGDYAGDSTWFDYPAIAMTHDEIFLTGNKIKYDSSWIAGFDQSVIYQVKKSDGYSGATNLTYNLWDSIAINNNINLRNIFPVKGGAGPHGPGLYFLSNRNFDVQNDTILLLKITDTIGGNPNLTVTALQSNIPYGVPPNGRQDTVSFTGVDKLATNDGRILGAYVENNEIQFVSATVETASGASGIYVGKITNVLTSPSVTASIFSVDTLDFGYPNISYTGNQGANTSIISFDYTGAHTFAGLGAIYYDGTQFSDLVKVKEGVSVIDMMTGLHRWGDYTGSQPYYSNIGKVWITGIYGRSDKRYGIQMAELGTAAYANVDSKPKAEPAPGIYPNPALEYVYIEFSVPDKTVVDFFIYNMQGKQVDKIKSANCKKGKNLLQFNTGALPPGNYLLKGTSLKGELILTEKFTRQ